MAWSDFGKSQNGGSGRSEHLLELKDGANRIRLLIPETGPRSWWNYAISAPNEDYRSWPSPPRDADFFARNRKVFKATPRHAGHVWDYVTNTVKVLEAGNQVWEQIKALIDAGVNIYNRDFTIMKTGDGRGTSYKVVNLDPTPFPFAPTPDQFLNLDEFYQAPTYEQVLEDLRAMGFTHPEQIFTTRPLSPQEALAVEVPFGQHKGKTLEQVYRADNQYLLFLATKVDRADIKEAARVVTNAYMGTAYELSGVGPSMEELAYVPPAPDAGGQSTPPATPPATPATQAPPIGTYGGAPIHAAPPVYQPPAPAQVPLQAPPAQAQPWMTGGAGAALAPQAAPQELPPYVPPAGQQVPPYAETPAQAAPPQTGFNRQAVIDEVNARFGADPKYKDFMLIISVMKEATAPHGKTSINDFTDEELTRLRTLVLG